MKIGTTRLETFSDGVIAIVITIMILELKLPDLNKESTASQTLHLFHDLVPYLISYIFSFVMIGVFWTNHHHMFHLLQTTDERLVWQNFVFLFFISIIPFATSLVGASPRVPLSAATYGLVMLLTTLSFLLMRNYSLKNKLLHKDEDRQVNREIITVSKKGRTKAIVGAAVYLVSIPLAFVNVYLAYLCFAVPPIIFFLPEGIDNEKLAEKIVEQNNKS